MKKFTLLISILMIGITCFGQTTVYVSAIGSDSNNGLTVGAPKLTLSNARGSAGADGTIIIDGSGGTLFIPSGQLNIAFNLTFQGINDAVIDGTGNLDRMFSINASGVSATFKDFTIQNKTDDSHGGVFNVDNMANTILTLENIVTLKCTADNRDGNVFRLAGTSDNSVVTIKNCYFDGETDPQVIGNKGGAIYFYNATSELIIVNSTIRKFSVDDKGGAIYIGGASIFTGVNITIADNVYTGTSVGTAAGIHFETVTSGVLQNSIVINNSQPNRGTAPFDKDMDISAASGAYGLEIKNSILGTVTNNVNINILDPETNDSENNLYATNEAGD